MMETDETPICNGNLEGSEHDDCEMVEDNEIVAELSHEQKVKLAEQKKLEGNQFYTQKNYRNALALYTEAIDLCPTCAAYYGNRSATYLMLYKYQDALEDSRRATALDDGFVKGYLREGKCHLAMGNATAALNSYQKVLVLDPKNNSVKSEMNNAKAVLQFVESAEGDFEKGDFRRALYCMDRCLDHSPACPRFKVMKAEALAHLGRYQESQESANDVLRSDNLNADAIYVRGVCLYYEDQVDKAYQHFQQVLRLAPDHVKSRNIYKKAKSLIAKKEEGNQAFRSGHLEDAYRLYTEALEIDPNNKSVNSKLFCNRATVCSKLTKLEEAIEDCSKAIELDSKYLKAYLRRAKCYSDTEKYEEAVRDYEKIFKMEKSHEHKRLLQEAKLELKKSKRKDFYKVLGVSKNATDDEIKKAYKKRALIHHPDRHSHDTPEKQREEEKIFKEIGEAYSILSDPKKKARYDSGQDLEDMEGGFADFDPNTIFQAFFGGGQQGFSFGGGPGFGGRPSNSFHQSNSFPGGFSFQFG